MKTAILIDGGYFLRRFPACYPSKDRQDAKEVAKTAFELALSHLTERRGKPPYEVVIQYDLHRISSTTVHRSPRRLINRFLVVPSILERHLKLFSDRIFMMKYVVFAKWLYGWVIFLNKQNGF
jgi:hypothetical protein